jgi:hypothetical protein
VDDPLGQQLTLAAVLADLLTLADAPVPPEINPRLGTAALEPAHDGEDVAAA